MNSYQEEQLDALNLVSTVLADLSPNQMDQLHQEISPYLEFRQSVEHFLSENFSGVCTRACYQSQRSACCSKDGIITFFADVLINAITSTPEQLGALFQAVKMPAAGMKCIYLAEDGCLWQVKPSVCVMFLCESAQKEVYSANPAAEPAWRALKDQMRCFTWPDRPVLFDRLEQFVLDRGYRSALMYLHNSPGLMRVKQRAGL